MVALVDDIVGKMGQVRLVTGREDSEILLAECGQIRIVAKEGVNVLAGFNAGWSQRTRSLQMLGAAAVALRKWVTQRALAPEPVNC